MFEGIDPSIGKLLEKFVEHPACLSHLLFVGPPGSGKTTTAHNLVKAFYKERKTFTGKALFLNSSDERSLDAVRSKVYPFARSQMHVLFGNDFLQQKSPKIIIFDEAETLTEQAQSALRPLLDKPANELLIIFLCNSISRIHSSILHRFLRIYFETPSADQFRNRFQPIFSLTYSIQSEKKAMEITKTISPCDIYYRRGDIRFFLLQYTKSRECNSFGWFLLHIPKQELFQYIERCSQTTFIGELINQALFLFQSIGCIDPEDIVQLLSFADADLLAIRPLKETVLDFTSWVQHLRGKFEF
jgi:ATPase family associated with various cellular activities (AAA)